MSKNKNPKRDVNILKRMLEQQDEIREGMRIYKISKAPDLSSVNIGKIVRRGFVHAIADMTEAAKELTDTTLKRLNLRMTILKPFRNVGIHQYGQIDDVMLYAIIQYCISKDLTNNINDVLASLAVTSEIGDTHV